MGEVDRHQWEHGRRGEVQCGRAVVETCEYPGVEPGERSGLE